MYENPYALSIGVAASSDIQNSTLKIEDPFEKQNDLYSKILGREVELYTKIEATSTENSDSLKQWNVTVPPGFLGYLYINKDATAGSYWPVALTIDQRTIENEAGDSTIISVKLQAHRIPQVSIRCQSESQRAIPTCPKTISRSFTHSI